MAMNKSLIISTNIILDEIFSGETHKSKFYNLDTDYILSITPSNVHLNAFCTGLKKYFVQEFENIINGTNEGFLKKMGLDENSIGKEYSGLPKVIYKEELQLVYSELACKQAKEIPDTKIKQYSAKIYASIFPFTHSKPHNTIYLILKHLMEVKSYIIDDKKLKAMIIIFNSVAESIYLRINGKSQQNDTNPIFNKSVYIKGTTEYKELEDKCNKLEAENTKYKTVLSTLLEKYNALVAEYGKVKTKTIEMEKKVESIKSLLHINDEDTLSSRSNSIISMKCPNN